MVVTAAMIKLIAKRGEYQSGLTLKQVMGKFRYAYVQVNGSSLKKSLNSRTEHALLAQPSKNDSQARTSRFARKGENHDDEILELKRENASLTNQND